MIKVYEPYLPELSRNYMIDAYDSTYISSNYGKYLGLVEDFLKEYFGVKHVLLTNNGTSATHLVSKCLKHFTGSRTVLVPNNVYVAAWNTFLYDRYFNLLPIDADEHTWNIDLKELDKHIYTTDSVLIVHNLGNPVNVPDLKLRYPHVTFVEDACETFGGYYGISHVGTESLCSSFSFYANKNVTSGEGGCFITNDDDVYNYARLIWGQGQSQEKFLHSELGYNYRMTNIQAAILYGQLQSLDYIEEYKEIIRQKYYGKLAYLHNNKRIAFQSVENYVCHPSNWMIGIRIFGSNYKTANQFFSDAGIETRPMFYPINRHEHLRGYYCKTDVATLLNKEVIILPSHPNLTEPNIMYISRKVEEYVSQV